jgi:hypothetical protein
MLGGDLKGYNEKYNTMCKSRRIYKCPSLILKLYVLRELFPFNLLYSAIN